MACSFMCLWGGRRVYACFITSALNEIHITMILCASTIMKHANRVIATILTNVFSKERAHDIHTAYATATTTCIHISVYIPFLKFHHAASL